MLSYSLLEGIKIDDNIGYARRAHTSSGYIINKRIIPVLIKVIQKSIEQLTITHNEQSFALDIAWFPLQKIKEWYYFIERVGLQRGSFSNVANRYCDYKC